uniref:LAGLIDADG endonuclease n=1 Tax=Powellomyces hirtus TaxID=109895 RepID=A0A4P8NWZ3_9FUNG|nr:LAGLIDADG endonuclease [Powellomyces hirtus]
MSSLIIPNPPYPSKRKYQKFRLFYKASGFKGEFTDEWLDWFIGFFEADGCISTYKNRNYLILTQKEEAILSEIFNALGFGRLFFDKNVNAWRWNVSDVKGAALLILLLNGNLVVPYRITQLDKAVKALNSTLSNPKSRNYGLIEPVVLIDRPLLPSLNDSWLRGFTDGEGCFNVEIRKYDVRLRFLLDQNDFEEAFKLIRDMFGGKGSLYLRSVKNKTWRLQISDLDCLANVIEYYTHFPLRTKKNLSFQKWVNIYNMVLNGDGNTAEGLAQISVLKKDINPKG